LREEYLRNAVGVRGPFEKRVYVVVAEDKSTILLRAL